MIENKNQLKKALKEGKILKIKRIYNFEKDNKIPEGSEGVIETVQSNAFTIKYPFLEKACWVYYDIATIEIKDNKIIYYQCISETFDSEKDQEKIKYFEGLGAKITLINKDHKFNKNYEQHRNYIYIAYFPIIINEIIEK